MPKLKDNVEKIFYSIGEVAKHFNVNVSLIRFWEKQFYILKTKKNKNSWSKLVDNIRFISIDEKNIFVHPNAAAS